MALPRTVVTIVAKYSSYRPRKDERLSWPSCLTYSGWFTHISGYPVSCRSSAGQRKLAGQRPTFYRCATEPWWCGRPVERSVRMWMSVCIAQCRAVPLMRWTHGVLLEQTWVGIECASEAIAEKNVHVIGPATWHDGRTCPSATLAWRVVDGWWNEDAVVQPPERQVVRTS